MSPAKLLNYYMKIHHRIVSCFRYFQDDCFGDNQSLEAATSSVSTTIRYCPILNNDIFQVTYRLMMLCNPERLSTERFAIHEDSFTIKDNFTTPPGLVWVSGVLYCIEMSNK